MVLTNLLLAKYFTLLFATASPVSRWNPLEARDEAKRALLRGAQQLNNPFCKNPGCSVEHEILGEYELPYKTHKAHLIVAASKDPQRKCQTCGPVLSFFEFTAIQSGRGIGGPAPLFWQVTHSDFAITEWGQMGEPFERGITVDELGNDVPGVFVVRHSAGKDGTETTTDIYARLADGFRLVASIPTGFDRGNAAIKWTADISPESNNTGLRDLIVKSSGTNAGKKLGKTERYHFNGSKYELAAGTPTLTAAPAVVRWDSVGARHEVFAALETQAKKPNDAICEMEGPGLPGQTPEPGYKCSLQHEVLGEYDLPYKTHRAKLVLVGSGDPRHNCDGCGVSLSFFELTLAERGWQLTHSGFGVGEWGQDGKPTLEPITVDTLGDDVPSVYAERSQMHQGIREVSTDIYARLETGFRDVGSIDALLSAISLDPRPGRLHDLLVKKSWTEGSNTLRREDRYHFNGKEFVLVKH
jgi:hypothetical protein